MKTTIKEITRKSFPKIYSKLQSMYHFYISSLISFFGYFKIQNKIVFISYYGKTPSCNPLYIYKELQNRKNNIKCIWAIKESSFLSQTYNITKYNSIKFFYHLATSKVWISNVRLPYYWKKRTEQIYIQTWHGGISLKRVEKDAIKSLSSSYIQSAMNDSSMTNLMISNSVWLSNLYRRAFWYEGEILKCGLPREDIFFSNSNIKNEIKNRVITYYNLKNIKKLRIALYVPTFRVDGDMSVYNIDYNRLLATLNKKDNNNWIILIRLHPNIQNQQDMIQYNERIFNGSNYADINDLIIASDIVISDYSSAMFDALLANKIVFVYATDIEKYNKDRGMLFDLEELPFSISSNNNELIDNIDNFNNIDYINRCNQFMNSLELYDCGHASKCVVDWIQEKIRV